MHVDDVTARRHGALRRHPEVSEDEVAAIAAVVIAVVGEVTLELEAMIAELGSRVEALEATT